MFRRSGKQPVERHIVVKEEETPSSKSAATSLFEAATPTSSRASLKLSKEALDPSWMRASEIPTHFGAAAADDLPETTLGAAVSFRGELRFERFLRIDGTFEGELLSQGKIFVGPQGKIKADINLQEAIIEGTVEGNITVRGKLELRGNASIKGDIRAQSLRVEPGVSLVGSVTVLPKESAPSSAVAEEAYTG